jgi:hypothetical protein
VLGELNYGLVFLFLTDDDYMVALLAELRGEINGIELRTPEPELVKPDEDPERAMFVAPTIHSDAPFGISSTPAVS